MGGFQPSYAGIGQMLTSDAMQADMLRRARAIRDAAVADAPYDPKDTGDHYKDHFHVESGVQHGKTSRAYGRVFNDHPAAVSIEFGTGGPPGHKGERTPAHHTLLRATDAAKD